MTQGFNSRLLYDSSESVQYFDVNKYVKELIGRVDEKLEVEVVALLRQRGWTVDKPQEGVVIDDLWWRVRGAVMGQLVGLDLDYETRSRIAEDAARDVKESVGIERKDA